MHEYKARIEFEVRQVFTSHDLDEIVVDWHKVYTFFHNIMNVIGILMTNAEIDHRALDMSGMKRFFSIWYPNKHEKIVKDLEFVINQTMGIMEGLQPVNDVFNVHPFYSIYSILL